MNINSFKHISKKHDFSIRFYEEIHYTTFYIKKRPGAEQFLKTLKEYFVVLIFTASTKSYADAISNALDPTFPAEWRFYRDDCTFDCHCYVKDLAKFNRSIKSIVLVDNSHVSYSSHPDNGIPVSSYLGIYHANELLEVILPFQLTLKDAKYVRQSIRKHLSNHSLYKRYY